MKKKFLASGILGLAFIILIILVCTYDVAHIGPFGTAVGFSTLNKAVHETFPFAELWYDVSEILGYLPIATAGAFVLLGVYQTIKRKSLLKVDKKLIGLGGLYAMMVLMYAWFELVIINYRPVVMPGEIAVEASFPSSHTMLACVIMGGAFVILKDYIKIKWLRVTLQSLCVALALVTVVARFLSGVHWLTDIVGGVLISLTLVTFYGAVCDFTETNK